MSIMVFTSGKGKAGLGKQGVTRGFSLSKVFDGEDVCMFTYVITYEFK